MLCLNFAFVLADGLSSHLLPSPLISSHSIPSHIFSCYLIPSPALIRCPFSWANSHGVELVSCQAGVVHCPSSNFNLMSGVANVRRYLDEGIKVRHAPALCLFVVVVVSHSIYFIGVSVHVQFGS